MPRVSTIKNHPERKAIERDIVSGKSKTRIAKKYNITQEAINWHEKNNMITRQMITAVNRSEESHGLDVLENLTGLIEKTEAILEKAENRNNNNQALSAIRELRNSYALISAIQLKLIELQQQGGEASEDDMQRREAEESFRMEFEEGLGVFCQTEHAVWDALHMKAATRNTERIPGINYTEEDDDPFEYVEESTQEPKDTEELLETSEEEEPEPPMRAGVQPEPDIIFEPNRRIRRRQW